MTAVQTAIPVDALPLNSLALGLYPQLFQRADSALHSSVRGHAQHLREALSLQRGDLS